MQENPKLYIETYGCQMNFADSEIVTSVMIDDGFEMTKNYKEADLILINTCSIRDNAEQKVLNRLNQIVALKKIRKHLKVGVIGCMAERLKDQLFELGAPVDIVAGPDSYRNLPDLIDNTSGGKKSINVLLSEEETYENIHPVRLDDNKISAYISIMRGCENFCSYCVVPYTRGKERSRNAQSILEEAKDLFDKGYREVTLLGQNVNSYNFQENEVEINFAKLIEKVAKINPLLRVRFATSHPKDISDELIAIIATYDNICNSIHLPVQSGSTTILERMNRKYTREWYLNRINKIKELIDDVSISTDIIAGFCGETVQEHEETLTLMREVGFDFAFMYKYSERPNTYAWKKYKDDISEEEKLSRLDKIIKQQSALSLINNKKCIGKTYEVLVEGVSKRSKEKFHGRTSQNRVVVFEKGDSKIGTYVNVLITDCTAGTLRGEIAL